jgi:hypothetical protein
MSLSNLVSYPRSNLYSWECVEQKWLLLVKVLRNTGEFGAFQHTSKYDREVELLCCIWKNINNTTRRILNLWNGAWSWKVTKPNEKRMSTESESKSISSVPKWDGKVESCAMYLAQISALAEYHDCGDMMDSIAMIRWLIVWPSLSLMHSSQPQLI